MKKYRFPKWLSCAKKNFHLSKEKMEFSPFSCFGQNHENSRKSIFSLERWKFFLPHQFHLGRRYFFIFYTFLFGKKNGEIIEAFTFLHFVIFAVFGQKMSKILIFMKKSEKGIFSMSNFGQKRFSLLFIKIYIWPR